MTAETKPEGTLMAGVAEQEPLKDAVIADTVSAVKEVVGVAEEHKLEDKDSKCGKEKDEENRNSGGVVVQKSASFREESNFLSDLKEHERKALFELRDKLEEAILGNKLFKDEVEKAKEEHVPEKPEESAKGVEVEKTCEATEDEKPEEDARDEDEKKPKQANEEKKPEAVVTGEEEVKPQVGIEEKVAEVVAGEEEGKPQVGIEVKAAEVVIDEEEAKPQVRIEEKAAEVVAVEEEAKPHVGIEEKAAEVVVDEDVSIWGVPLLPSKGRDETDVILLKFLRAREFKVDAALEMLKSTLRWRKESNIDSILEEESLGAELGVAAHMDEGVDREGHPICYNFYGVFQDEQLYQNTFGTEEKTGQFLRWRFQLMEKGIQRLDFKPGGATMILQIIDLKNAPGLSKKELRVATKRAVSLLQDNYPEFVARNVFINVPFWYYAFNALLSPFLTQRTKSKLVFSRPAKVTETLLRYIPAEEIPLHYGGLRRENDTEFSAKDGGVCEVTVKAGSTENIELPAPMVGTTLLWDLTVLGWEVNYKEEFVPDDEGSYTIIVQKGKKMGSQEQPLRNSFRNNEPGKLVLTIENNTYKKKKVLYRYKAKESLNNGNENKDT